jgi:hypothetical protein
MLFKVPSCELLRTFSSVSTLIMELLCIDLTHDVTIYDDPFEAEARLNNIYGYSPYYEENTALQYYKNQLVTAV